MKAFIIRIIPLLIVLGVVTGIRIAVNYPAGFYGDSARDLLIVESMRNGKYFPAIGHENIAGYNVPIYYYILYIFSLVTGDGYREVQWIFTVWRLTGLGVLYYLLKEYKLTNWEAALLTLATGVSAGTLRTMREIFSINLVYPLGVITFFFLLKTAKYHKNRYFYFALISLGVALTIDFSMALFIPVLLFWIGKVKATRKEKLVMLTLLTVTVGTLFWWIFSVNSQVYGGGRLFWEHLKSLIYQPPKITPTSWSYIVGHFLSDSIWINQEVAATGIKVNLGTISTVVWVFFGILLFFTALKKKKFPDAVYTFTTVALLIIFTGGVLFNFLTQQLFHHHFMSISYAPTLLLALLWRNWGKLLKLIIGVYVTMYLIVAVTQLSISNSHFSDYQRCLAVAETVQIFAEDEPYTLIYLDENLNVWETTKYFYCLTRLDRNVSAVILGGSFGVDQVNAHLFNVHREYPQSAFVVCPQNDERTCTFTFNMKYNFYNFTSSHSVPRSDLKILTFTRHRDMPVPSIYNFSK